MEAPISARPSAREGDDVRTWSGTRLARAIRSGERSSEDVVRTHLAHLERVNPALNAVVCERRELALAEARAVDAAIAKGTESRRFAGVPCTIKESFAVRGMPLTAGLVSRKGTISDRDAVTVRRLTEGLGAIALGTTNVSELLMWMESSNHVYGRCSNPYDASRIAGGSSGGEGSAIGAGISPFGLGADIGGSIRLPAFFGGVFGHKATGGLIPNAGQWPLAHGAALRYLCTGPLARRAEDLWPLVSAMAGPDPESPECVDRALGDPGAIAIEGLRVITVPDNGLNRVHPELARAQARAAEHLRARGARVEEVRIPALKKGVLYWSTMMSAAGGPTFASMLWNGERRSLARELAKIALGRSPHTLPAVVLAGLEELPKRFSGGDAAIVREAERLKSELADRIGDGVMLYPTYTRPAPRHRMPLLTPIDWAYTALINVMELPCTQVPLGLSRERLPLGCQVIGRHFEDQRTVAVALELERAFGGWVPPWSARA